MRKKLKRLRDGVLLIVPDLTPARVIQEALAMDLSLWSAVAEIELLMREVAEEKGGRTVIRRWSNTGKDRDYVLRALRTARHRIVVDWLTDRARDVLRERDANMARIAEKRRKAGLPPSRRRP